GGRILEEYSIIKSFLARTSEEILTELSSLSSLHKPRVEDNGKVTIQQKEQPLVP
ncbi:MAG: hypothetical protein LQ351_008080, partial [Letrouitia transgressa]